MSIYLDCNATTPLDPKVQSVLWRYLTEEYGNAASPYHPYGEATRMAVETARGQIAKAFQAKRDEVIFTSGATEANNLALFGIAAHGAATKRRHIITSAIEHKSVAEPLERLAKQGFDVTFLKPTAGGWVDPCAVQNALRHDTLLVSLMQANNETGIEQPLTDYVEILRDHPAYFHVDAAQGFGKGAAALTSERIDLISLSGHKLFAPQGIGALIVRKRAGQKIPLEPIMSGGGQEQNLRPGTLPVALIAGFGTAVAQAMREGATRREMVKRYRQEVLAGIEPLEPMFHGDQNRCLPHVLCFAVPGIIAENAIRAVRDVIAISSGSACTAHTNEPSHVLSAMGIAPEHARATLRLAWCHLTPPVEWSRVVSILNNQRHI